MTNTWPGWQNAGLIGEGSFGKVYKIRREEFGQAYEAALKVITIPASQADVRTAFDEGMDEESVTDYFRGFVEDIVAEFALMSQLKGNSNIVSYEDHMVVEHEDKIGWDILIRMELLTPLNDYAAKHPLKEEDVIRLGMDLARALTLCRRHAIIHRDIKPENIFVSRDGNFKLGDFGVARITEKTVSAMSKKGTYNYMAPEVYKGQEYGYPADLYSLGLVLYRFLNDSRTPFLPPSPERIQYRDRERALNDRMSGRPVPPPAHGSEELKKVVLRACAYRPEDRYGDAKELEDALFFLRERGNRMRGAETPPPSRAMRTPEPPPSEAIRTPAGETPAGASSAFVQKRSFAGPGRMIGIDLGDSNTCMAVMKGGRPTVIPSAEGGRTIPSMVAITEDGRFLAGEPARRQALTNSEGTFLVKRCLEAGGSLEVRGKRYGSRDICVGFMRKLKADAESYLEERVTKAVFAVPADFGYIEREAVMRVAQAAGLEVCRILHKTAAIAWAYGFDNPQSQKILVCDLGGGGLDMAAVDLDSGLVEMLATLSEDVSGMDFDRRLTDYIRLNFKRREGVELARDDLTERRLMEAAEKAKRELSSAATASIYLPCIATEDGEFKNLEQDISRAAFEELTGGLVDRIAMSARKVCERAGLSMSAMDRIVPVGGLTRIPAVWEMLKAIGGREPVRSLNPDECVALGAALQCGKLERAQALAEWLLLDVAPATFGLETEGGKVFRLVEKDMTLPLKKQKTVTTTTDYQTAIDVYLVQGEAETVDKNRGLGRFRLDGIAPAAKGTPRIQVSFDVDLDGIIRVGAQNLNDGGRKFPITWLAQGVLRLEQEQPEAGMSGQGSAGPAVSRQGQNASGRTGQDACQQKRPDAGDSRQEKPEYTQTARDAEEDLDETISIFSEKKPQKEAAGFDFGGADVKKTLDSLFGGNAEGIRGEDIKVSVQITLEEAVAGCQKIVDGKLVTVPAGIDDGQTLRVKGQGKSGPAGGASGNLMIRVQVLPHRFFTRQGMNLYSTVTIPARTAKTGARIRIQTIDGTQVERIGPNTKSGTVLCLKGKGMPSLADKKKRGDHMVTVRIKE